MNAIEMNDAENVSLIMCDVCQALCSLLSLYNKQHNVWLENGMRVIYLLLMVTFLNSQLSWSITHVMLAHKNYFDFSNE